MDKNLRDMNTDNKKTEKLVSALYLLTSFFDDKEPMKWRLRELGGILVTQDPNQNLISDILGLLRVSRNVGLISDTNFDIIHREFSNLSLQGQSLVTALKELASADPARAPYIEEKAIENKEESLSLLSFPQRYSPQPIKDKIIKKSHEGAVEAKKNGRQGVILDLLKKKREIMVRDLTSLIKGVSEKTIQRELLSMVSKGILKKEGEKRWSRYALA